jgi:hypothetical protein
MRWVVIVIVCLAFIPAVQADEPFALPGHQPFNPNAQGNPYVGGNPYTFNNAMGPYGTGGNPSTHEPSPPITVESPLTLFEQTGGYRGALAPPPAGVDTMGSAYGRYGDRHSLDSLKSMRGSDHPLSPFGHGWRIPGNR